LEAKTGQIILQKMEKLIASWRSVEPEENRFRFYSLSLGEDLWGEEVLVNAGGGLVVENGRIIFGRGVTGN